RHADGAAGQTVIREGSAAGAAKAPLHDVRARKHRRAPPGPLQGFVLDPCERHERLTGRPLAHPAMANARVLGRREQPVTYRAALTAAGPLDRVVHDVAHVIRVNQLRETHAHGRRVCAWLRAASERSNLLPQADFARNSRSGTSTMPLPIPKSRAEIAALQRERKIAAVENALRAPFHRQRLKGIDPKRAGDPAAWREIPLLLKEELRALPPRQ